MFDRDYMQGPEECLSPGRHSRVGLEGKRVVSAGKKRIYRWRKEDEVVALVGERVLVLRRKDILRQN